MFDYMKHCKLTISTGGFCFTPCMRIYNKSDSMFERNNIVLIKK